MSIETLNVSAWDGARQAPVVRDLSCVNGLAFNPHQLWAFRRADLTGFAPTPFMCENGMPAVMAPVKTLPPTTYGLERLLGLARLAVDPLLPTLEVLRAFEPNLRVVASVCVPELAGSPHGRSSRRSVSGQVERLVAQRLRTAAPDARVEAVSRGHASGAFALIEAGAALAAGYVDVAIVGGVDTYYDPDVVEDLIDDERIFDSENPDSFVGGEGAAFALLTRPDGAMDRLKQLSRLAVIEAAATAFEPGTRDNDVPCVGLGLTRASRAACQRLRERGGALDWWISDMTGEDFRTHEFQLAWPRAANGLLGSGSALDFLPQHVGDMGVATIPTALALAAEGMRRGDPQATRCLVTASSTGPERAAVLIRGFPPDPEPGP